VVFVLLVKATVRLFEAVAAANEVAVKLTLYHPSGNDSICGVVPEASPEEKPKVPFEILTLIKLVVENPLAPRAN